jgi:hypothetical protein
MLLVSIGRRLTIWRDSIDGTQILVLNHHLLDKQIQIVLMLFGDMRLLSSKILLEDPLQHLVLGLNHL